MDIIFDIIKKKYNDISNIDTINITGNTSNINEIIINNNKYICKINKYINIKSINMAFENEIYFYINLRNYFKKHINIPEYFDSININDENNIPKCIILEKLDIISKFNFEIIYKIINEIIKMHIFFWNKNNDFLNYENNTINIINQIKKEQEKYLDIISNYFDNNIFIFLKEKFLKNKNKINNNYTIIHGSLKNDNICSKIIENNIMIYFIDWTYFRKGYGVEDILYLLIFSISKNDFKLYYSNFINYYFNEINKYHKYTFDEYNFNIIESLYGFILTSVFGILIINKIKNKINNMDFLENYLYILSTL